MSRSQWRESKSDAEEQVRVHSESLEGEAQLRRHYQLGVLELEKKRTLVHSGQLKSSIA